MTFNRKKLYKELYDLLVEEQKRRQDFFKKFDWLSNARPEQLPPKGDWRIWIILAGRGFGKTRTGAETLRNWIESDQIKHIGLIGQSCVEAKQVMVEGESGLLNVFHPHEKPIFHRGQNKMTFQNGATAQIFGANNPEKLRGPQFDCVWIDEFAKFKNPKALYDQIMMGLRLGKNPRCIITTTPRPHPFLQELIKAPGVVVSKGSTFDNAANLAPDFLDQMKKCYTNTRLGAQELYAEILTENEGALWNRDMIRYQQNNSDDWRRIVIAIDPATTHHEQSDETGIVVAGLHMDGFVYILEDLSGKLSPTEWGTRVTDAYWRYRADRVVAEVNKGGDLVERVVKSIDSQVSFKAVRATRGKIVRAEPVAALYEQKKIYHIRPFSLLETQLCSYTPHLNHRSPDRMDALVWAVTDLLLVKEGDFLPKVWL